MLLELLNIPVAFSSEVPLLLVGLPDLVFHLLLVPLLLDLLFLLLNVVALGLASSLLLAGLSLRLIVPAALVLLVHHVIASRLQIQFVVHLLERDVWEDGSTAAVVSSPVSLARGVIMGHVHVLVVTHHILFVGRLFRRSSSATTWVCLHPRHSVDTLLMLVLLMGVKGGIR